MGLHIPDHETDTCRNLMAPAWIAVGLQNDLYSWPKERYAAQRRGDDHVVNAIWVLMQEYKVDLDEAIKICRKLIKQYVAQYVQIVKDNTDNELLSRDLRKYIEAMQFSISGNVIWSLNCPRYNPHVSFNKIQLDWMHNGIPALDSSSVSRTSIEQDSASGSPRPEEEMPSAPSDPTPPLLDMDLCMWTEVDNRPLQRFQIASPNVCRYGLLYINHQPGEQQVDANIMFQGYR